MNITGRFFFNASLSEWKITVFIYWFILAVYLMARVLIPLGRRGCSVSGSYFPILHKGKGDEEFPECFLKDQTPVAKTLMESPGLKE